MDKEEKKAVECLKKQYKQSAEKKDATLTIYLVKVKRILKLIEKQQKEIETWKETENDYEHELARKEEEIKKQQKEIKKLKERIKEAIRFFEGCKTDTGTYVLFLSETEYLSGILKGE